MDESSSNVTSDGEGAPAPASANDARRQIPGYQILQKLGAGAMAVVFKAKQISLDRIVAIKVLPRRLSSDADYVMRFYQEGQTAAKLNHPNIVQAFDVGESEGYHYFIMEYVEGKTVYDEFQAGKKYTESEALGIGIQIAVALVHAHAAGLIHRDVKPKNIMITQDGVAKLMDMGLARLADDAQAIAAESGKLFGTPYYISPEQILGKNDVDFRCDIYSLGATLYHMVTGRPPYEAEDSKSVMIKHVKEKLTPPDRHNIDLSFGLCKIICRMMSKHREHRHATTQEMLEDLQSVEFLLEVDGPADTSLSLPDLGKHMNAPAPAAKPPPPPAAPQAPSPSVAVSRPVESSDNSLLWILLMISVFFNVLFLVLWAW